MSEIKIIIDGKTVAHYENGLTEKQEKKRLYKASKKILKDNKDFIDELERKVKNGEIECLSLFDDSEEE